MVEERFLAYKHALLAYLGRFVEDLRRLRPEIAARLAEAGALGADAFLRVAVAADLPAVLEGVELNAPLTKNGWYEKFPPAGIEPASYFRPVWEKQQPKRK